MLDALSSNISRLLISVAQYRVLRDIFSHVCASELGVINKYSIFVVWPQIPSLSLCSSCLACSYVLSAGIFLLRTCKKIWLGCALFRINFHVEHYEPKPLQFRSASAVWRPITRRRVQYDISLSSAYTPCMPAIFEIFFGHKSWHHVRSENWFCFPSNRVCVTPGS